MILMALPCLKRLQPYLAEVLGAALAHVDVRPVLVVVSVPEQEVPDYLGCDIEEYLGHIVIVLSQSGCKVTELFWNRWHYAR
jgi:hypothetical protein